jgi:hypothetical protein
MRNYVLALVIATAAVVGCGDAGTARHSGTDRAKPAHTDQPFVWDSREELLDWAANAVTRGPITVEGDGAAAFIRVKLDVSDDLMRGPGLALATGVRGARSDAAPP